MAFSDVPYLHNCRCFLFRKKRVRPSGGLLDQGEGAYMPTRWRSGSHIVFSGSALGYVCAWAWGSCAATRNPYSFSASGKYGSRIIRLSTSSGICSEASEIRGWRETMPTIRAVWLVGGLEATQNLPDGCRVQLAKRSGLSEFCST